MSESGYFEIPAYSATIAKVQIEKSPAHALHAMRNEAAPTALMDRGAIMHRMLLGKGADIEVIQAPDWRTKAAREQRDKARAEKRVPILDHAFESAATAARAIAESISDAGIVLDGESEFAIGWHEKISSTESQYCRCRMDHFRVGPAKAQIFELKIVSDASESAIERSAESMGYGIAAAAYTRAATALHPKLAGRIEFYFIFAEADPPYAINICAPDAAFMEIGNSRWVRAVEQWHRCAMEGEWPAYGRHVNPISVPRWVLMREGFPSDER